MIKKWMPKIVSSDHEIERDREIKEIRTRIVERLEEEKQNFIFHPSVCTFCHRLCHFLKKYLLHHLDNFYSFYKDNHE